MAELPADYNRISAWDRPPPAPLSPGVLIVDFSIALQLLFETVGGLGLFLLGMKNLSDGMQAVAGGSLRRLIGSVTNNRLLATAVGTTVTCIVQSSSITTVMVVGFVNSGLMKLAQAIGVIMGANIGTTITGWILVLNVGKYGLPMLGAAAFIYLFTRVEQRRFWAMAVMGVGMVFFGLELMKDACGIIKEMPQFEHWFQQFQADSYLGVLQCALVGCVLTTLVQSSSATLGITISLAHQGVISYPTAAALVLGENIGTTITALLASLGATTNARRAAYFHTIFNLAGVFWITLIFSWYVILVPQLINVDPAAEVIVDGVTTYPQTTPAIAATHSIFNVFNTLLFLPFLPAFVWLLERLVPAERTPENSRLTELDMRLVDTPSMAIEQSRTELQRMAEASLQMLDWLPELRAQESPDKQLADRLKRTEAELDAMQDELSEFITHLLSGNVTHAIADEARRQLRMADEYESISDYIADLDKFDRKLRRKDERFSKEQRAELHRLNGDLREYLAAVNEGLIAHDRNVAATTESNSERIRSAIKQMRRRHLEALSAGGITPTVNVAYLAALNAYSRVRDHTRNIAESISGEK